jgi:hypothetical protein
VRVRLHDSARQRRPSDAIRRAEWGMAYDSGGERRETSEERQGFAGGGLGVGEAWALRRRGRREQVRWPGACPKPCPRPMAGRARLAGLARKCHPLAPSGIDLCLSWGTARGLAAQAGNATSTRGGVAGTACACFSRLGVRRLR